MYLAIRAEALGNRWLIIGPFSDATQRSLWKTKFFHELSEEGKRIQEESDLGSVTIWDAEDLPNVDTADAKTVSPEDVAGQIASALH